MKTRHKSKAQLPDTSQPTTFAVELISDEDLVLVTGGYGGAGNAGNAGNYSQNRGGYGGGGGNAGNAGNA